MTNFINLLSSYYQNHWYLAYLLIITICYLLFLITKNVFMKSISHFFKKTSTNFDDKLLEHGVFKRISYLIPLLFLYTVRDFLIFPIFLERVLIVLINIILILSINSIINTLNDIYSKSQFSKRLNIKSYIQVIKLIINILGVIIIIALATGKSPIYFLSGIGALTAVLMLVFKDTILSLVSSIQISSNNLFKVGDWIEAPQFGADGDVIDIALHSVKIQNWDKTITIIPTHQLINSSFKNWKGMSESGGRRIKRSIKIDMSSIKFCNNEMIQKFKKFSLIKQYINDKIIEVDSYNEKHKIDKSELINGRSLTNVGTFRAYVINYLKNHKNIHKNMTFLVRQLPPMPDGLPIEIYVFSNDTNWVNYESIQADIFDHLLSIVQEFELSVFQHPSGNDFKKL